MRLSVLLFSSAILAASVLPSAHAAEKHLVYMQGCCVKGTSGPAAKDYQTIAQKLGAAGFNVFFELRTADQTDSDEQVQAYATKVAEHVQGLIAKGVAPEDITVSGFSLGSMTTLVASGLIDNPKVGYVLLAGCPVNATIPVTIDFGKVRGRVLSVVEGSDDKFGSCSGRLPNAASFKEVTIDSGKGHKLFKLADEQHLKLWMQPLEEWAKGQ